MGVEGEVKKLKVLASRAAEGIGPHRQPPLRLLRQGQHRLPHRQVSGGEMEGFSLFGSLISHKQIQCISGTDLLKQLDGLPH